MTTGDAGGLVEHRLSIWRDFLDRRLSVIGLARKYGRTVKQIEAVIRRHTRRVKSFLAEGKAL